MATAKHPPPNDSSVQYLAWIAFAAFANLCRNAAGRTTVAYPSSPKIQRATSSNEFNLSRTRSIKPWLRKVRPRVVDLLLPFRGFRYHHPDQNGSNSMKAVLPALTGKGYEKLAIQEGGAASREFLRVTFGQVTAAERRRVRRDLEGRVQALAHRG